MKWLRRFTQRALAEKRLDSELQFHVEQRTEDYLAEGIARDEARRQALLEFGGVERFKEECRETHWENQVDSVGRDFRFALRGLMKDRGFACVPILALALGIG